MALVGPVAKLFAAYFAKQPDHRELLAATFAKLPFGTVALLNRYFNSPDQSHGDQRISDEKNFR